MGGKSLSFTVDCSQFLVQRQEEKPLQIVIYCNEYEN